MTFEEFGLKHLTENGMFGEQAGAVMAVVIAEDKTGDDMWRKQVDGYPDMMKAVVTVTINRHALEWIDANLPKAWYRPMFMTKAKREALFAAEGIDITTDK